MRWGMRLCVCEIVGGVGAQAGMEVDERPNQI